MVTNKYKACIRVVTSKPVAGARRSRAPGLTLPRQSNQIFELS